MFLAGDPLKIKDFLRTYALRVQQSQFARRAGSLVLYTVAGQLITVIASLFLARLFAPSEIGLFGLLLSFPSFVGNAISLNFHAAAPAPLRDEDGAAVTFGSAAIVIVMSFVVSLIFLAFVTFNVLGYGALPYWSCFIVWLLLATTGLIATLQYWCIRRQTFKQLGEAILFLNSARAGGQIALGSFWASWGGLALGELLGRLAQVSRLLMVTWNDLYTFRAVAKPRLIFVALLRYKRFATILLPPIFLETVWATVPVPAFNLLFGLALTGQYYLMRRILDLPVAFISSTISDTFYGKISEYARTDPSRIRRALVVVFLSFVSISAIAFLPLVLFGPSIFAFLFGPPWRQAGLLTALMVPAAVLQIGTSPVARVFAITKRPGLRYPFTISEVLGGTAVFFAAWAFHLSIAQTVGALSFVHVLSYSIYIATAFVAAGHIDSDEEPHT